MVLALAIFCSFLGCNEGTAESYEMISEPSSAFSVSSNIPEKNNVIEPEQSVLSNWKEDILFFQETCKQDGPGLFYRHSEDFFDDQIDRLLQDLDEIPRDSFILFRLKEILASMNDAHANFDIFSEAIHNRKFPFFVENFGSDLYFTYCAKDTACEPYLGMRLVRVNKADIHLVSNKIAKLISSEQNEYSIRNSIPEYLKPEILDYVCFELELPLIESYEFTVVDEEGRTYTFQESAYPYDEELEYIRLGSGKPLYQQNWEQNWLHYDAKNHILYVALNNFLDTDPDSYVLLSDEMEDYFKNEDVSAVFLDMRNNYGGNGNMDQSIHSALYNYRGKVYIGIGGNTMSAGVTSVVKMKNKAAERKNEVILIGEPTGQYSSFWAQAEKHTMPHSGIDFWMSTRLTRSALKEDGSEIDPETGKVPVWRNAIFPDIYIIQYN